MLIPGEHERGSVAVSILLVTVLMALAVGGIARTTSVLRAARQTQNFSANLSWADSAISDVQFKLDQGQTATGTCGSFSCFSFSTSTFRYTATRQPDKDHYIVQALGNSGAKQPHGVQVTLRRRRSFAYGLYTRDDLVLTAGDLPDIKGTTVGGVYTPAIIGSSGSIKLPPGADAPNTPRRGGDGQDYFYPSGACINCYQSHYYRPVNQYGPGDSQHLPADEAPKLDDVTSASVPTDAVTRCNFADNDAMGQPHGNYVCNGNVKFTGTTTVPQTGSPVSIYQLGPSKTLNFNDQSINAGGITSQLQIYKGGTGTVDIGQGGTLVLNAIVYAPQSDFTPGGQGMTFTGSMVLKSLTSNGNSTGFHFNYDAATAALTRDWKSYDYHEIPSTQVP